MAQIKKDLKWNTKVDKAFTMVDEYFEKHKMNESSDSLIRQCLDTIKDEISRLEKKEVLLTKVLDKYTKEELVDMLVQ